MLLDLVVKSVNEFQHDCLKLCEKHYPTVHNHGMSKHHLALAFARRMQNTLGHFGHESSVQPLETSESNDLPHHYRVSSNIGTVWVISHHLVSASYGCRQKLLQHIAQWQSEYSYAIQPSDLLFIVSDHWIGRSRTSRELFHWWMGEFPQDVDEYRRQGVQLFESRDQFQPALEDHFGISPCYIKFGHPLQRTVDKASVKKYLQLYAVIQW